MNAEVILNLGSNLQNPKQNIGKAVEWLDKNCGKVVKASSLFHSKPWGYESKNNFTNITLLLECSMSPQDLIQSIKNYEIAAGRNKKNLDQYEDRVIDIDIILFEDKNLKTSSLEIPHPLAHEREFVILPLLEVKDAVESSQLKNQIDLLISKSKYAIDAL